MAMTHQGGEHEEAMSNVVEFEHWRPVVTHPGLYEVSDLGRVRSCDRVAIHADGRRRNLKGKLMKLRPNGRGYLCVDLALDGSAQTMGVASLVCAAFNGPRPSLKHETAHNNGVKTDNRASNVRWATRAENMADKHRHGTMARGERSGRVKLTEAQVIAIRADGRLHREIAADYEVSQTQVSAVKRGRYWAHLPMEAAAAA